jgi:hydrogenase-4 component B
MMVSEGSELIGFLFKAFLIVLFSGIFTLVFVPVRIKRIISVVSVLLVALITSLLAVKGFSKGGIEVFYDLGTFLGQVPVRIDGLSAWFIIIINFTSLTGVLYGAGYLNTSGKQPQLITFHWILFILFQSSMIIVSMVQHSIVFLIAWEIMSLSSFLLVFFDYSNPKVLKAGINYLVQMHLSVVLLTVAFIWVYFKTGTFDFKGISIFFGSDYNIWLFILFFAGFAIKAGFIGFHTWLPQAHPAAPSHVSGVMSGVIVKMGIYSIFRIITFLSSGYMIIGEMILTVSLLTGLIGILNAAVHRDFKKMLAYCTIENIGIIGIGIGIGLIGLGNGQSLLVFLGFGGALLHVLNHSLFKSLLFFSAGSVYRQTHTRDMDKLGGLIKVMPKTAFLFLTGSVAIGGIPPLNGFVSEFLIYCGILAGMSLAGISHITLMIITFAGMSIIGGISVLTFTKTFSTIFLGSPRTQLKNEPEEVSTLMIIPQLVITAFMLLIAFFPGYFLSIIGNILNSGAFQGIGINNEDIIRYSGILKNISLYSFLFVAGAVILYLLKRRVTHELKPEYASTWGCGYTAPNPRMQYTGKSFSKSLSKLLNFILIEKKEYSEIGLNDTFPGRRKYRSFYLDFFGANIVDPVVLLITRFINLFQFFQNGKIQAYVIYGIVFILAIFLGTVLKIWN